MAASRFELCRVPTLDDFRNENFVRPGKSPIHELIDEAQRRCQNLGGASGPGLVAEPYLHRDRTDAADPPRYKRRVQDESVLVLLSWRHGGGLTRNIIDIQPTADRRPVAPSKTTAARKRTLCDSIIGSA